MPKVYFAGASRQWEEVRALQQWLTSQNFSFAVTLDWTEAFANGTAPLKLLQPYKIAAEDIDAILEAAYVIGYLQAPRPQTSGFWVELGFAIATGKQICVLVECVESDDMQWLREAVFLHHPRVQLFFRREDLATHLASQQEFFEVPF